MTANERPATMHLESWAGRVHQRVTVIGETPKRYRVRYESAAVGNWTGRIGTVGLVPKYAITFDPVAGVTHCPEHGPMVQARDGEMFCTACSAEDG